MRILADANITGLEELLPDSASLVRFSDRQPDPRAVQQADALLVRSVTQVDSALLAGTPVRFVGSATSGYEHVDREWLAGEGIEFAYAPGANANSVVEYVLTAIAATGDYLRQLFQGGTLGIVGSGHVGRLLATRTAALGIEYCVYDPWLDSAQVPEFANIDEVLGCDVVSLHPELTKEKPWPSYHLLDQQTLKMLRTDSLLINTSRGSVVDNRALFRLLSDERSPKVILDVWEGEPNIHTDLMADLVFGTPHIAGYSLEGKLRGTAMLLQALYSGESYAAVDAVDCLSIALPAELHGADLVSHLLLHCYDIAADDRRLRDSLGGVADGQVPATFDRLRREYPQRRELAGAVVQALNPNHQDKALLAALGVSLEQGAGLE